MMLMSEDKHIVVVHHTPLRCGVLEDCALIAAKATNDLKDGKLEMVSDLGQRVLVKLPDDCIIDWTAWCEVPAKIEVIKIYD